MFVKEPAGVAFPVRGSYRQALIRLPLMASVLTVNRCLTGTYNRAYGLSESPVAVNRHLAASGTAAGVAAFATIPEPVSG